jgi:CHAT domain-containing protein
VPAAPRDRAALLRRAALVLVLLALGGCGAGPREAASHERVARTLLRERFTAGRLAGQDAWAPCSLDTAAVVPRSSCGDAPRPGTRRFRRIARATEEIRRMGADSAPGSLHARALAELRWHGGAPARLDRAAAALEQARGRDPGNAAILNDLAVVYLEIGERDQLLRPMLQALDAAEQAVERDSTLRGALFNRALILQRLHLLKSAERAWARYRAVERDPRWRGEADVHARRLGLRVDTTSLRTLLAATPGPGVDSALDARVRATPHEARELGLQLLSEWGTAVEAGDAAAAARALALARRIAAAAERLGGDRSVPLAVLHLDAAAADPARLRPLARAYALYGAGTGLWQRGAYEQAADTLGTAARSLRAAGAPTASWATYFRAGAELNQGRFDRADSLFRQALAQAGPARPGLAGRAVWGLGITRVRRGHYELAGRHYREAAALVARAREPDNLAAIAYLLAETLGLAGQSVAGGAEALRGLRMLSPYRRSNFLNNHLATVAAYAQADGQRHATLALRGEVLEIARTLGRPDVLAWALCARAADLHAVGRTAAARAELDEARRWVDSVPAGKGRDRVRADVALVLGRVTRREDPRAAVRLLSDVVQAYRRVNIEIHLPVALYEAALAARDLGDVPAARTQLREAVTRIERQQDSLLSPEVRATHTETVENVFDAMVAIELDGGRPASAFEYLERSRIAAWPPAGRLSPRSAGAAPASLAGIVERLPRGMLLVEYALLQDRIAVWTASRRGWKQHTVPVPRDTVAALARRFALEMDRAEPRAGDARARLYDLLVGPLAAEMEGMSRLVVVPDRELNHVPFAALWATETGRYLVQDHEVRTVPSAAFFVAARGRGPGTASRDGALVVGNPAMDAQASRQLPPLPGAAREARSVASLYGRHRLLTGADARRGEVERELPRHAIFHFAGHAVFNSEQPELSYLALARDSLGGGTLHAWEIGRMRLSNVSAVILSACSTLSPRPSRAGPTAGLAYSFLRAGAPATVSTLWDVTDDVTTGLLVEFHRHFAAGRPAPEALRAAQLQALASPRPELRAPRAWAAFIYTGP